MKPIISPWIFYFAEISLGLKVVICLTSLIFLVITIINLIAYCEENDYNYPNEENICCILSSKKYNKSFKKFLALTIISSFTFICIPSNDTVYKMLAAKYATSDNIETVYDKIIDGAAELGEAWHGDKDKEDK